MSYILEALKSSDLERENHFVAAPRPGASYAVTPGRRTLQGRHALWAGGLLAVALALAVVAWGERLERGRETVVQPVQLQPEAAAPLRAAAGSLASPLPDNPPVDLQKSASISEAGPGNRAGEGVGQGEPKPEPESRAPAPRRVSAAPGVSAAPRREAGSPGRGRKEETAGPGKEPAPGESVLAYRDLPAGIRNRLPGISFGGYAGEDDAAARIAFINDKLVKEGEEAVPGVRLERAGREGVILMYQGYRFLLTP